MTGRGLEKVGRWGVVVVVAEFRNLTQFTSIKRLGPGVLDVLCFNGCMNLREFGGGNCSRLSKQSWFLW